MSRTKQATKRPTRPSTPRLSEAARHVVIPSGIVTTGWPRIEKRLATMAVTFDPWQAGACQIALGKRKDGKYAATIDGITLSIPRQVGKTFMVGALLIAMCLEFPGLKVVWTAHHLRTSTLTFRAMQGMVKRKGVRPHLAPGRNDGIRTANGEQEIGFRNGSIIMFGARSQGFGRGFEEVDVEVFDEAQILKDKALEDMVAATNQARHIHGALLFYIGTPPRPEDDGEAFTNKRRKALKGELKDGAYIECSADPDADLDDPEQWKIANASYPTRTPHESMLRLRANLPSDDAWRREGLGIWDEFHKTTTVPGWPDCFLDAEPPPVTAIGLAVSLDGEFGSIASADLWPDADRINLSAVERRPGSAWLVAEAKRIQDERHCVVTLDEKCPDGTLLPALIAAGVKVLPMKLADYVEGCSDLTNRAKDKRVTHQRTTDLDNAVANAKWRPVGGDGRQVFGRKASGGDIDMLEAATAALWAANQPAREFWGAIG